MARKLTRRNKNRTRRRKQKGGSNIAHKAADNIRNVGHILDKDIDITQVAKNGIDYIGSGLNNIKEYFQPKPMFAGKKSRRRTRRNRRNRK